jgi:hypothetical protein
MLSPSSGLQHTSSKCWLIPTDLHGDLTQKNIIRTLAYMSTEEEKFVNMENRIPYNTGSWHTSMIDFT